MLTFYGYPEILNIYVYIRPICRYNLQCLIAPGFNPLDICRKLAVRVSTTQLLLTRIEKVLSEFRAYPIKSKSAAWIIYSGCVQRILPYHFKLLTGKNTKMYTRYRGLYNTIKVIKIEKNTDQSRYVLVLDLYIPKKYNV